MTKCLKISLSLFFIFQLLVAQGFELAHDEAYYWLFSKNLDWGYFDHPPFVALMIKMFSFLPRTELSIRLGSVFLQLGTILVLLSLVEDKKKNLATKLFLSFPLASAIGLFALPDTPLVFMATVYLWAYKKFDEEQNLTWVIVLSLSIAGLMYAKYHGVIIVFFTLLSRPSLFKKKSFYLVFILSLLLFTPHLHWQYEHNFATFRYHFLERPSSEFSLKRLIEFIGSQVLFSALLVGPVIWWITLKIKTNDYFSRALKFISVGSVVFFFISSFSKKFEANWTIYLCSPLILLVVKDQIWDSIKMKWLLNISLVIVLVSRLILLIDPSLIKINRLKEFHGWKKFAKELDLKCDSKLLANTYQLSSKLSFYLDQDVHSLNLGSRKNQFDFWNYGENLKDNKVCFLVKRSNFTGEIVETPELNNLVFIKNIDYNLLVQEKLDSLK